MLLELTSHFFDDFFSCVADCNDGPRAEHKDSHGAEQAADEDLGNGDVNDTELLASHHLDFIEIGGEKKEAGKTSATN